MNFFLFILFAACYYFPPSSLCTKDFSIAKNSLKIAYTKGTGNFVFFSEMSKLTILTTFISSPSSLIILAIKY